jgi:hypothetical protein
MNYTMGTELCGEIFLVTNVFKKLFEKHFKKIKINNSKTCDIIIRSCLSGNVWNNSIKPYIYWSGENRIPKKSNYENNSIYVLTTKSNLKNSIYIPFCLESYHINKNRLYENNKRDFFIGYCCSNRVDVRENLFNKFVEKIGINKCISFGSCYGNYKETNRICEGDYQNLGLIKNYSNCKFVIAMENSIGDGYITEKIVNAFYSGAIPIYWGSPNINDFFNKESFINVSDFNNLDECIEYVINLTDEQIKDIQSKPIYTNNELINIFNDDYNKKNNNKTLEEYKKKISNFIQCLYLPQ